jgi:2-dehydropantoate 2-reductase
MLAILGPGGVGGFLAGALQRNGMAVTVVARADTAAAIAAGGIAVESVLLGTFTARPSAVERVTLDADDTLIVATKATGLAAALGRIEGSPGLVLPLLNGLDHMVVLRERFGRDAVPAASIRIVSDRPETGRIVHTSRFLSIDVAPRSAAVDALAATLSAAGVPVDVLESEAEVLWGKLVRLNALACTTSAWDLPLGEIRADPERRAALEACVREAAAVAEAEGAHVSPEATMAELDEAHSELRTSMQRDIAAGREPELDAIPGSVLRAAARHALVCPTIGRLSSEAERRARAVRAPMG